MIETHPFKTFEFIKNYFTKNGDPVRFSQYDSWFYPHGEGNGLKEWEIRTDEGFFPNGGEAAFQKHGYPLVAHNRWFGPDNVYDKVSENFSFSSKTFSRNYESFN